MISTIRRNPIIRVVAVLALALGMFAVAPAASGAAEACVIGEYGNSMQLTADPTTVRPGDTVTIDGSGFPADCTLGISVGSCDASDSIGIVTTDENGNFTIDWVVPANQKPGDVLICTTISSVEVTASVTVASTSATTVPAATGGQGGSGVLPKTGSQILPFLGGGVILLVVGSLLVLSSRKRKTAH